MKKKNNTLRQQVFSGMVWRFMERGCVQVISFVLQIVLARLLEPEDYGVLAVLNVFISFSTTLINNGLGNAIIQKKDADEVDFNTIFYIQLGLAGVLVILLNIFSPYIASYYNDESLSIYLRVMSVILILEALASIQMTALRKSLQFKKSFYANVIGTVTSGVVGVAMALKGFGCWALIGSQISMKVALFLTYFFMVKWRPKAMFSFKRFKSLFSYSWKLTVAWLIGTLHQNVFTLVIGKRFSKTVLGFYDKGQNLPNTMKTTVNETISTVMFSALAKIQDDKEKMKESTRKMMSLTAFIIFPVMAGVAGVSKSFVYIFLTEKWAPCIPMMQLFCISLGINIISTTNMQSFNALGKSDVFMKLEIIKRSLSLLVLLLTSHINIYAVIIGLACMGVFSLVYNIFPNRKLIGYTLKEQIEDMLPSLILSVVMFLIVWQFDRLNMSFYIKIILQVLTGIVFYGGVSYLLKIKAMKYAIEEVENLLKSRGK